MNTSASGDEYPDYSWNDQDPEEIQDLLLSGGPNEGDIERALCDDTCTICEESLDIDDEHVCSCKCEDEWQDSEEFCLNCGHRFECFISNEDSFACTGHQEYRKIIVEAEVASTKRAIGKPDLYFASLRVKALVVKLSQIREDEKRLKLESEKLRKRLISEVFVDTNEIFDSVDGALLAWLETKEGTRLKPGSRQSFEEKYPEIVDEFFESYSTTYLKLRRNPPK